MIQLFAQAVPALPTNGWDALVTVMPGVLACIAATVAAYFSYLNGQHTNAIAVKTQAVSNAVQEISVKVDGNIEKMMKAASSAGVLQGAAEATEKERAVAVELLKATAAAVVPALTHEDVTTAVVQAVTQATGADSTTIAKATADAIAKLQRENLASIADRAAIHEGMIAEAAREVSPIPAAVQDTNAGNTTKPALTPLEQRVGTDPFSPCGKKAP